MLSSSCVILDLMDDLLGKGYCVVTDNYYTCPSLYAKLLKNKTDAYGTVRLGRKSMPPTLKKAKLRKHLCNQTVFWPLLGKIKDLSACFQLFMMPQ